MLKYVARGIDIMFYFGKSKNIGDIIMSKILLNSAFVGSYANNIDNLSREVINFVRADNGRYYIYLSPYGNYTKECDGVDYVLFVKNCGNGIVEILAKAEVKEDGQIFSKGIQCIRGEKTKIKPNKKVPKDPQKRDCIKKYTDEIIAAGITYGDTTLSQIFKLKSKDYDELVVTMEVKDVVLPKRFIGLTSQQELSEDGRIFYMAGENKLTPQSMRRYFDESSKNYGVLKQIIDDKNHDIWGARVETYENQKKDLEKIEQNDNFFKATLQQDNEVMFSNMLFYFFQNYPDMFEQFADEILGLKDAKVPEDSPLWITREEKRMDLKIVTDKFYIIIENKIKSGINGIKKVEQESGEIESQLSKYYDLALEEVKELNETAEEKTLEIKGYIFCPRYNDIKKSLEKYKAGDKYKVVYYSELYKFFKDYNELNRGIKYLDEFVKALEKHIHEADNERRYELMLRLQRRIKMFCSGI